jgi:hypothetical protein
MKPGNLDMPPTGQLRPRDLARGWLAWCRNNTGLGGKRLLELLGFGRHSRVGDAEALGSYLVSHTDLIAASVTVEYCRARSGLDWDQLTTTPGFLEALERCRWEAFAVLYPDVAETCQILLRHAGAPGEATGVGLGVVAAGALLAHPVPLHRSGWDDVVVELHGRLGRALLAAPHAVHLLGGPTVIRILEHIPYHPRIKTADRDLIASRLRLGLCGIYAELERTGDLPTLVTLLQIEGSDRVANG